MCKNLFKCVAISWLFISVYAQAAIVSIGATENLTGSVDSLTNNGIVLLNNDSLIIGGMTINNGVIDFGASGSLTLGNGSSNGDNALRGGANIAFTKGVYSNPTVFTINGSNPNFTANIALGDHVHIALNSASGLGSGSITAGQSNYLTLDIEGSQTWRQDITLNNNGIHINKTGSGELYLKGLINTSLSRDESILTVSAGSVHLNPDKSVYDKVITVVESGANVYFDLTKDSVFASYFKGGGNITQTGGYTLNITESGGAFSGTYHVKDGSLMFVGKNTSSRSVAQYGNIVVHDGSSVGGWVNLFGNVTLKSGSAISIGDTSKTRGYVFNAENVHFEDGSLYELYAYNNDKSGILTANHTINIGDNTAVAVYASPDYASIWGLNTDYIIAKASSINGSFSSVSTDLAFLTPTLSYSNTNVILNLRRNNTAFDALAGLTQNQINTARALEDISFYSANNTLVTTALGKSASGASKLFDLLSGEFYASSSSVQKQNANEVKHLILNHIDKLDNISQYQDWVDVWSRDYKGSNSGYHDIKSSSYAVAAGFDSSIGDNALFGILLGFERSKTEVSAQESQSSADTFYLSLYGSRKFDTFSLKGGIAGGISKVKADRYIKDLDDALQADYNSYSVQLFAQADKKFEINDRFALAPYAGLSYLRLSTEGFKESGNVSALKVKSNGEDVTYLSLGVNSLYALKDWVDFTASFGFQQAFGDVKSDSEHSFSGKDSFTIYGAPIAKSSAKLGLGLGFQLSSNLHLAGAYEGEYAKDAREHSAHLQLNYKF
jgi:uncharacterized protein with beta-barrel porin domain